MLDIYFTTFRELVQDQAEALIQAPLSTSPLLNYSPHLGCCKDFCSGFPSGGSGSCALSNHLQRACTAFVYALLACENRIRDIKVVKLSVKECRKGTGKNIFGIGY